MCRMQALLVDTIDNIGRWRVPHARHYWCVAQDTIGGMPSAHKLLQGPTNDDGSVHSCSFLATTRNVTTKGQTLVNKALLVGGMDERGRGRHTEREKEKETVLAISKAQMPERSFADLGLSG